jgi:hypothetical protein
MRSIISVNLFSLERLITLYTVYCPCCLGKIVQKKSVCVAASEVGGERRMAATETKGEVKVKNVATELDLLDDDEFEEFTQESTFLHHSIHIPTDRYIDMLCIRHN